MGKKKIAIKVSGGVARSGASVAMRPKNTVGIEFMIEPRATDTDIERILEQRVEEQLKKEGNASGNKKTT